MVYLSQKRDNQTDQVELPVLLDPALLRAARQVYRTYCALNPRSAKRPLGVAINEDTHRGQLIFGKKAVLLPGECFVPLNQLESEVD